MRLLERLFGRRPPSSGDALFSAAMRSSDDLISNMRQASSSKDVFRAIMADIWQQHHNIPFMTTVFEAVREMRAATSDQQQPEQNENGSPS